MSPIDYRLSPFARPILDPADANIAPIPVADPLTKRIAHYRRLFTRGRGRKTNGLQSDVVMLAAILTAKAEFCALDPTVSLNDLVRIDGAARRARADMEAALHPTEEPEPPPSFAEMVANG